MRQSVIQFGLSNAMRLISKPSCSSGTFPTDDAVVSFREVFNSRRMAEGVCGYLNLDADYTDGDVIERAFKEFVKGKTVDELPRCFVAVLAEAVAVYADVRDESLETFFREGVGDSATAFFMPASEFVHAGEFFPIQFDTDDDYEDDPNWYKKLQKKYMDKLTCVSCAMPVRGRLQPDAFDTVLSFLVSMGPNEAAFYKRLYKYFKIYFPKALARRGIKRAASPLARAKPLSFFGASSGTALMLSADVKNTVGGAKRAGTPVVGRRVGSRPSMFDPVQVGGLSARPVRSMFDPEPHWSEPPLCAGGLASLACSATQEPARETPSWRETLLSLEASLDAPLEAPPEPVQPLFEDVVRNMLKAPTRRRPLKYMEMCDLISILNYMNDDTFGTKEELIKRIEFNDAVEVADFFKKDRRPYPYLRLEEDQTKEMVMAIVSVNGLALRNAALRFRRDDDVVRAAYAANFNSFVWASSAKYHEDKVHALPFVAMNGHSLQHLSLALRGDPEVIKVATETTPAAVRWALRPSYEVMQKVLGVPGCGECIEFARREHRGFPDAAGNVDLSLARLAVENSSNGFAVTCLSPEAKAALQVDAVRAQGMALQHYVIKDPANVVRRSGMQTRTCHNAALVAAAVANDGLALKYASPALCATKAIVQAAVKQNPYAFQYADPVLKADVDLMLLVAGTSFDALNKTKVAFDPEALHGQAFIKIADFAYDVFVMFQCAASAWTATKVYDEDEANPEPVIMYKRKIGWDSTCVLARLSQHGPYYLKGFTKKIGDYIGDPTGAKTAALIQSAYNLRYYDMYAFSTEHVKYARARRLELWGTFKEACCRSGGARFEGFEANFSQEEVYDVPPPPRIFTEIERAQVLLFLVTCPSSGAHVIAARHLNAGTIPESRVPDDASSIVARF